MLPINIHSPLPGIRLRVKGLALRLYDLGFTVLSLRLKVCVQIHFPSAESRFLRLVQASGSLAVHEYLLRGYDLNMK